MSRDPRHRYLWPLRVYYEDTDAGGVVYHAAYLRFMERARTEWLRSRGVEQDWLRERHGLVFAVTRVDIRYHRPARFNQLLDVVQEITRMSRLGLTFHQRVCEQGVYERPLCEAEVRVVAVDAERMVPRRLPLDLYKEISE